MLTALIAFLKANGIDLFWRVDRDLQESILRELTSNYGETQTVYLQVVMPDTANSYKIPAIKVVRTATGLNLLNAKALTELAIERSRNGSDIGIPLSCHNVAALQELPQGFTFSFQERF